MKHLKTFEKWDYAHKDIANSKILLDINDVTGLFDEAEDYPTQSQLDSDWKEHGKDLEKVKDLLIASNIPARIEKLDNETKDEVGQYHIVVFQIDDDKLYSLGDYDVMNHEIDAYYYRSTSLVEYPIKLIHGWKYVPKELKEPHDEFNDNLLYGYSDDESYMSEI